MKIGGLQKFSLLDYPGKISALIFTQGCNYRCAYCHNPELVDPERYSEEIPIDKVLSFLTKRQGKLEAVTISGGEPTLQPDLINFITDIKGLGYNIKLDTNGSLPCVIKSLADKKLVDYWAMDIKSPLSIYSEVCGCDVKEDDILKSIELIRNSETSYEFRTTYYNQMLNWNDILEIQTLLKKGENYFLQQCNYDKTLDNLNCLFHLDYKYVFNQNVSQDLKNKDHHINFLQSSGKAKQIMIKMR